MKSRASLGISFISLKEGNFMKKYIFILALLLLVGPVNAQRVVKYITFYPVPYGSHERLNVEEEFMVNMGNDMTSEVGGEVYIDGVSDFEGFLDISAGSGANTVSTGTIRSGNVSGSVYGTADLQGSTFITNVNTNNTLFSANVAGVSMLMSNTLVGGKSIANLLNCSSPSWRSLRVKGSEECKTYLTCGGSGDTGCAEPPAIICETNYCLDSTNTCRPKPSTTRSCVGNVANAISGTQYRTTACSPGTGWSLTMWRGTCTCASGYEWSGSLCLKKETYSTKCYKQDSYFWCNLMGNGGGNCIGIEHGPSYSCIPYGDSSQPTSTCQDHTGCYACFCTADGVGNEDFKPAII